MYAWNASSRILSRTAIAALTMAVQFAALWMLLQRPPVHVAMPEQIFYLPITRRPKPPPAKPATPEHVRAPAFVLPPEMPRLVQPDKNTALRALHRLFFNCAPGQILNDDDRRRCQTVTDVPQENPTGQLMNRPSRAKQAPRWARARARKTAPTLLPCMPPSLASLFCLGEAATNGLDLDSQPGYFDAQAPQHLPNNGDSKPLREPYSE